MPLSLSGLLWPASIITFKDLLGPTIWVLGRLGYIATGPITSDMPRNDIGNYRLGSQRRGCVACEPGFLVICLVWSGSVRSSSSRGMV